MRDILAGLGQGSAFPLTATKGKPLAVIRSVIRSVGAYLPKRVMTNEDMSKLVDTTDAWITERTGIKSRHIAEEGEFTSDLGIAAAIVKPPACGVVVNLFF